MRPDTAPATERDRQADPPHRVILVGATADEPGHDALALGVALARALGAQVVLAGVAVQHGGPPRPDHGLDATLHALYALRDDGPSDVPITVQGITSTSVLRGLHDLATGLEAEVLVLGPSHRGTIGRALHGDTAADAVFAAPCAVAVARPGQAMAAPATVGVAWNATPEADEALEWAARLAQRSGARMRIIRALEPSHAEGSAPEPEAREQVRAAREAVQRRVPCEAALVWGDPARMLTQAGHELDLLVLAARERGPVRRVLLGSVSADVIHHASCPVVVLPGGVHAGLEPAAV
jgi:nucleotide-binding universal stress UspA family protein